jgi:chemotaxis protein MotB
LTLSGHTDATPYAAGNKGYSNWELSADRANASRREMTLAGMPDNKMLRVVGLASSVSLDEKDPYAAVNRRIAIVVMNKRAEAAVRALANLDEGENPNLIELPPVPKVEGLPFPKNGVSTN